VSRSAKLFKVFAMCATVVLSGVTTAKMALAEDTQVTAAIDTNERPRYFAWCTGAGMLPPETNLLTRDRECGLLANSFARLLELRLAGEDEFVASLPDPHATKGKVSEDGLNTVLMNRALVCRFMNERRSGAPSPNGECFAFDERMNGSTVDLMTLTSTISDLVPPAMTGGKPDASGLITRGTAKKIAHERILRHLPANSTVPDAKRALSGLGFRCKDALCRFDVEVDAYHGWALGLLTYTWHCNLMPDATDAVADVVVRLERTL
jgi:hypothetical protein